MNRSANYIIEGYLYQFDYFILTILESRLQLPIVVEGIEDVDWENNCVQVKYHSTQRYSLSKIKKPILRFLEHFMGDRSKKYTLYAHFNDWGKYSQIGLKEAKTIINGRSDLIFSDQQLKSFIKSHFRFIKAENIETQRCQVLKALEKELNASSQEVAHFYNNALNEIITVSCKRTDKSRTITKRDFLKAIDNKAVLFNHWLCQVRGERDYEKYIRNDIKRFDAMKASKHRYILIGKKVLLSSDDDIITAFCRTLIDQYFRIGTALYDAVPLTFIFDLPRQRVETIQKLLIGDGLLLNTGYEALGFSAKAFNHKPVINRKMTGSGGVTDKIGNSSYLACIISAKTYCDNYSEIAAPHSLFSVCYPETKKLGCSSNTQVFNITEISDLKSLLNILRK